MDDICKGYFYHLFPELFHHGSTMNVCINTRVLHGKMTGVQRYLYSILNNLSPTHVTKISPLYMKSGVLGHAWEQLYLPSNMGTKRKSTSKILWSPSNTGPIYCPVKQVVTIHDFATLDHPEWTSRAFNSLYKLLLPKLVIKCAGVITISEYTKSRILHYVNVDPDKIFVIKNGVGSGFYKQIARNVNVDCVLRKYNIPHGRYILSVSSIEPRKNISNLLKAWKMIYSSIDDDIYLVLVGCSNPRIFSDAGLSDIPPRVIFTGFVDDTDLPTLYHEAMLFVYLSLYEGFGLPPLEAMAAEVAVLTSNNTSIPEVVSDKAVTVDPLSISEITEALSFLLKDDSFRNQLANQGPANARLFNWEDTAKKTFDFIENFA